MRAGQQERAWGCGGLYYPLRRRTQCPGWEDPAAEFAARARAERTSNIFIMVVTLDVSQLDMSALNVAVQGVPFMSSFMSVTAETSQSPIVPCVTSAAASSSQNSPSAAARVALVANTVADTAWAIASKQSRRQCP